MNYQFGSSVQGKKFEHRGMLNSPPRILLSAVAKFRSYIGKESEVHNLIQRTIDNVDQESKRLFSSYNRPPPSTDVLYRSSFIHANRRVPCRKSCPVVKENVVQRSSRERGNWPEFHYGTIGSADNLMRDADTRDTLALEEGVLCVEMESTGLMNTGYQCIVIRGISDYADTHKNDEWHGYAAAAAATYAKILLGLIAPGDARQASTMHDQGRSRVESFSQVY